MLTPEKCREYAEECTRIAKTLPAREKDSMLAMAQAWILCAEEAAEDRKGDGKTRGAS